MLLLHKCCSNRKEIVRYPLQIVRASLQLLGPQPGQNGSFEGRDSTGHAARKFPYFEEKRGADGCSATRENAAMVVKQNADAARPFHRLLQCSSTTTRTADFEIATNAGAHKPANNNYERLLREWEQTNSAMQFTA